MKPTEQTTTSGAPLKHGEYAIAPKHIPNGKGQPFKTEHVLYRGENSTVKFNWWHLPDDDRAPHNHPWDFSSEVLYGSITEVRFTPTSPGNYDVSVQTHKAGETYSVKKEEYHVVVQVAPGTVTRMTCGPANTDNEWGYLNDLRNSQGQPYVSAYAQLANDGAGHRPMDEKVTGSYVRAQKDPDFMARFIALNPFLAFNK